MTHHEKFEIATKAETSTNSLEYALAVLREAEDAVTSLDAAAGHLIAKLIGAASLLVKVGISEMTSVSDYLYKHKDGDNKNDNDSQQ